MFNIRRILGAGSNVRPTQVVQQMRNLFWNTQLILIDYRHRTSTLGEVAWWNKSVPISNTETVLIEISNKRLPNQSERSYIEKSFETMMNKVLQPNMLYIYVERATAKDVNQAPNPGHVATFVTDETGVVSEATTSLHPNLDELREGIELKYPHPTDPNIIHSRSVHKVKFVPIIEDFEKFFRKDDTRKMHIVGIPVQHIQELMIRNSISLQDKTIVEYLKEQAIAVREKLNGSDYILCAGTVIKKADKAHIEIRSSLNCVTAAMMALGVTIDGVNPEPNPSPQMVARGFLILALGKDEAYKVIGNSLMHYKHDIRKWDIEQSFRKPPKD